MRVCRYVHSDAFLVKNEGTFPVEGNCLGANRQATEPDVQVCYDTYVLVVCTSSRYLSSVYFGIGHFVGSFVLPGICFWAHETIGLFCRSTMGVLMHCCRLVSPNGRVLLNACCVFV